MAKQFQHLAPGETISRREYNRITDVLNSYLASDSQYSFRDSYGIHNRRSPHRRNPYSLGFHGGGTPLAVATSTLTTIPIDFETHDPDHWLENDGFRIPHDGIYFASAAFWVTYGLNTDVRAYVIGREITGALNKLKSALEVTLSLVTIPNAMLFCISGMVKLDAGDLFQFMFWHEAGGANTMELGNSLGAHAGMWLIERI